MTHPHPPEDLGPPPPPAPRRGQPLSPFCTALMVVCLGVYAAELIVPGLASTRLPDGTVAPLQKLALWGPLVRYAHEWWRIPGYVLEHGGVVHILFNMSVVWTLGMGLERQLGTARFAAISLVTALGSAAVVLLLDFDQVTVGASGMILGWAGALLPIATREARRSLTTWLVQIAIISLLPFVSWTGHLGGFLAGLPCGLLLRQGHKAFWVGLPVLVALMAFACGVALRLEGSLR